MSDQYRFTGKDGKEYGLPLAIPFKSLRAVRAFDNLNAGFTLLEEHGSPEANAALDEFDQRKGSDILNGWLKALGQGATVGESSSSSS